MRLAWYPDEAIPWGERYVERRAQNAPSWVGSYHANIRPNLTKRENARKWVKSTLRHASHAKRTCQHVPSCSQHDTTNTKHAQDSTQAEPKPKHK